jgi:hypothetical protein
MFIRRKKRRNPKSKWSFSLKKQRLLDLQNKLLQSKNLLNLRSNLPIDDTSLLNPDPSEILSMHFMSKLSH